MIGPIVFLGLVAVPSALSEYIPPGPAQRCPANPTLIHPCVCTGETDTGISVRCENSNLATVGVGLSNLAISNIPLDELFISQCNIGRLYGSLLHALQIRVLKIEETPLRSLEDYIFLGVNQTLKMVYIINSTLSDFPGPSIKILGATTMLILDGHNITKLTSGSFDGNIGNTLERLRITNGQIGDLPIDVFPPLRRLKTLDLHGNVIEALKKSQFKGLRDLEALDLSHNSIKKLDSSHLADLTKLGWCNVSHNDIKELTRGTFARNTVLKVLNLSHNKIKKLDANSFRGMRFVRRLFFSDNEISDIGRGTFGSVARIGTIDLARNNLTKIDYQMFFQLNYVELVDVSENQVTEIQKLAFKDLYLVTINVSHNNISKIEPGAFENCANITLLDMSHNNISLFPPNAFDSTTYATHLYVPFNNLTSLNQIPMQNMTGLKILNASHNALTTVPKHTFPKLYELHTIDLSHNKLTSMFNGVFQVLFSLRFLDLSHNNFKHLKSSVFGALPTLLELDIRHNRLTDISRGAVTRLASLRILHAAHNKLEGIFQIPISLSKLDVSHNNISSIPTNSEVWPTMNSLLDLDLSYNSLGDSLGKGSFAGLLTLQHLKLKANNITRPPWEALSDLSSVQYLDFEGNSIPELAKNAFGRLPIVFELNLAGNNLSTISNRAFEGLLQLLELNLTGNSIRHIPNGAFQGLVSLRTLDLSHNLLEKLDNKTHGLLDDCLSLARVNLSDNKISFITRKTFPSDPYIPYRLSEIDLSYNTMPVLTYEVTIGAKHVQVLNVSHNSITEIRRGVIGNLTSLRSIDLSYNQIASVGDALLTPPANLSAIYLTRNILKTLPVNQIAKMKPMLRLLDVRGNHLQEIPSGLVTLLENKTDLIYQDNPVTCDCRLRPVRSWLERQLSPSEYWKELICAAPDDLHHLPLLSVSQAQLVCDANFRNSSDSFEVTPDLKFRDFTFSKNNVLMLKWLVTSKADIADFYLFIQEEDSLNKKAPLTIFEKLIAYSKRSLDLTIGEVKKFMQEMGASRPKSDSVYKVCMVALDSFATPGQLFDNQCKQITYSSLKKFLTSSSANVSTFSFYFVAFFTSLVAFFV